MDRREATAQEIFENLFVDQLLRQGVNWRLRKVHKILPQTRQTFRSRISYHVRLPRGAFDNALRLLGTAVARRGPASPLAQSLGQLPATFDQTTQRIILKESKLLVILPLALMRKALLLDFTVEVPSYGTGTLVPRHRASRLTRAMIGRRLRAGDEPVAGYKDIHAQHSPLIEALVYGGPGLDRAAIAAETDSSPSNFAGQAATWLADVLLGYFDSGNGLREHLNSDATQNILRETIVRANSIEELLEDETTIEVFGEPTSTLRSPFLAVPSLFELASIGNLAHWDLPLPDGGAGSHQLLQTGLKMAHSLMGALLQLGTRDRIALAQILFEFRIFSDYFIAYVPLRIGPDEDLLVKFENTAECTSPCHRSLLRRVMFPGIFEFPIVIGDAVSCHFEVASITPTEVLQKPRKTTLTIAGQTTPRHLIFPGQEHMTPYLQHLYTSKGVHEIRRIVNALPDLMAQERAARARLFRGYLAFRGFFLEEEREVVSPPRSVSLIPAFKRLAETWNESRVNARLRVYFGISPQIQWIGGFALGFLALTVLAYLAGFDPLTKDLTFLDTLPWLFPGTTAGVALLTLLLRVRVQEPIIHEWVRARVLIILFFAAALAAHTIIGFIWPDYASTVRKGVLRIPCALFEESTAIYRSFQCTELKRMRIEREAK